MAKVQTASGVGRSGVGWTKRGLNWRLDNVEAVTRNINLALMEMKNKSAVGMIRAADFILTDADSRTSPLVPEGKTGNLRASRFQKAFKKANGDPAVRFGYTANYAAAVHEMMDSVAGKPINWNRLGSGPKFLEASIKRNTQEVLTIIKTTME